MYKEIVCLDSTEKVYLDVSELIRRDAGTGIQRVVREICSQYLTNKKFDYFVFDFIYFDYDYGYCLVDKARFLSEKYDYPFDRCLPIDFRPGDVYVGLDLIAHLVKPAEKYFRYMQKNGVKIIFLLYDVIPLTNENVFPGEFVKGFRSWVYLVAKYADLVLSISNHSAKQYLNLIDSEIISSQARVELIRLGSNISSNMIDQLDKNLAAYSSKEYFEFLMVGTVEPRKGHLQILEVFELLAAEKLPIKLNIAGKLGWLNDSEMTLFRRLVLQKNVVYHGYIDDKELTELYKKADCLLLASYDEGYGLPIVEAAHIGLPVLCRNIEAFREVGANNVTYFFGSNKETIAEEIMRFVEVFDRAAQISLINSLKKWTWADCAYDLSQSVELVKKNQKKFNYINSDILKTSLVGVSIYLPKIQTALNQRESAVIDVHVVNDGGGINFYQRIAEHYIFSIILEIKTLDFASVCVLEMPINPVCVAGISRFSFLYKEDLPVGSYYITPKLKLGNIFVDGSNCYLEIK
jgi:glycosyltransferase involved in cell wall biosynthesis